MAIAPDAPAPRIEWLRFTPRALEERSVTHVEELRPALKSETVDWVHVHGFGDEDQLRALAGVFGIHPLALADIVNLPQRAKVDSYEDQQLIVLQMARSVDRQIELQQLSLVVGPGWVLTFEEHASDVFDPVRARLLADGSTLRRSGADFLAYALVDAVVDGFFPMTDMLDDLEEAAIGDPEPHTLARIHHHAFRHDRSERPGSLPPRDGHHRPTAADRRKGPSPQGAAPEQVAGAQETHRGMGRGPSGDPQLAVERHIRAILYEPS